MLWVLTECSLSALWVLFKCSLSAHLLLTYSWLIVWRFEPEWWRLTALDKLVPDRQTDGPTKWLLGLLVGAKNEDLKSFRQTCPGQTDRRTDKVTPWASVGAKNNKYMLNSFNSWKLLKFSQFLRGVGSQSLISAQILLNSLWVFNLIIPLPQHGRLSKRRIVYQFPIDWQ